MSRYVNKVETVVSADGNINEDFVLVNKKELEQLKYERDEYREISLELASRIPNLHEIQANVDAILASGGARE